MNPQKTTFIYGLWDPRNYQLRYIGKSDNPERRLKQHIASAKKQKRKNYLQCWINSLLSDGLNPFVEILEEVLISEWDKAERDWIIECKNFGLSLTNTSEGGEAPPNQLGTIHPHSEETKDKIRQKAIGRECTEETKNKIREANKGKIGNRKGAVLSEESKQKMRVAKLGKKLSEEHRRKISERGKGHFTSEETKEKIRKAHLGKPMSEEAKQHMRDSHKKRDLV